MSPLLLYDNLEGRQTALQALALFQTLPLRLPYIVALYCRQGEINISAGLHNYHLSSGQLLICINETVVSEIRMSDDCRAFCICLSKDHKLESEIPQAIGYFVGEINARPLLLTIPLHFQEPYIQLYHLLRRWQEIPDFRLRRQAIVGTFQTMMSISASAIVEAPTDIQEASTQPQMLYRRFITLLAIHYRQQRQLSFYADQLCITTKYLSRVVLSVAHRKAADIVRDYVILDAKALLRSGRYSISQIADELHFATPSFFTAYFRHAVGQTPTEYKG